MRKLLWALLSLSLLLLPIQAGSQQTRPPIRAEEMAGRLTHRVDPVYPPLARQARIEGIVHLKLLIAVDGSVTEVETLDGHPLLVQAAVEAARQWKYAPVRIDSQPMEAVTTVEIRFSLGTPGSSSAREEIENAGVIRNQTYSNRELGFTYQFPKGFSAQKGEESRELLRSYGIRYPQEVGLLLTSFLELDPQKGAAPAVVVYLQMPLTPVSAQQFVTNVYGQLDAKGREAPKKKRIAGQEFWVTRGVESTALPGRMQITHLAYYAHNIRNLTVVWVFLGRDKKQVNELMKSAKSIRFARPSRAGFGADAIVTE